MYTFWRVNGAVALAKVNQLKFKVNATELELPDV
jgi:hypothetical protein